MPLAIIRYILHFGQSLPTFFLQRARSPLLISVQRTTFLQWHCLSRRECTVTKMPSRGAGWVPFCELYTGGHWRCLEPLKNQRCARNWQQLSKARENQTTCLVPTHSHQGLREFCGWQQKEYGRNRRWVWEIRKIHREDQVERHVPTEEIIPGVLEMSGTLKTSKVGSCWYATSTELAQKLATIVESQRNPNISFAHSFPPGPSRVLWMTVKGIWKK